MLANMSPSQTFNLATISGCTNVFVSIYALSLLRFPFNRCIFYFNEYGY